MAMVLSCFLFMSQFPSAHGAMAGRADSSPPAQLVFTTQPGDGDPGTALVSQPVVTIEDSSNVAVSSTSIITLALTGPGGAVLTGLSGALTCNQTANQATAISADGGVATFTGCSVSQGGIYTITATDATDNLTMVSTPFFISGAAQLAFTAQPGGGPAGVAWTAQPRITVEDAHGQVVAGSTATIGLAIKSLTGTAGAMLTCTHTSVSASLGVASFAGCAVDKAGTGYQLVATDATDGLISPVSSAFDVNAGSAAALVFTTEPLGGNGGAAFDTQPVIAVEDAGGNIVTGNSDNITLSIVGGTAGAKLTCTTNPLAAAAGTATFSGCAIDQSGSGYTLTATDSAHGLSVTSSPFDVTAGSAAHIAFSTQPSGGAGGAAFGMQPVVALTDAGSNGVSGSVTLSIKSGTGTSGAALTCNTNPVTAVSGVATFAGCRIDKIGMGYILTATSGALSMDSSPFDVTIGSVAAAAFTTEPGNGTGGSALLPQPIVRLTDSGGNVAAGAVTLSLTSGLGTPGATLTCAQNPVTAVNGVAAFSGCRVDKVGSNYTLSARSGSVSATSSPFSVALGSAAQLAFTTQPSGGTGGTAWAAQPIVTVEDAGGNRIGIDTTIISLSITAGTGSGTLTCAANPLPAVNGAALFAGCAIDKAASAYSITASDSADGNLSAVSSPFAVTPGTASRLVFSTQPVGTAAGVAFPTQPAVAVVDAGGNTIPGLSPNIALSITAGTGTSGASLACDANPTSASQSIATFSGCAIDRAAGGYTLTARDAADGLSVESLPFTVSVAPSVPLGAAPTGIPLGQTFGGRLYGANPTDIVDHVNTATGALSFAVTDLRVAGVGEPLILQRTYNSTDPTGGSFGPGWTSLLDLSVTVVKNKTETVRGEDGQQLVWTYNPTTAKWVAPAGAKATLSCGSKQCSLTRFDGVRWDVNLTANGHQEIADYLAPDGQGLTFAWSAGKVTITVDTTYATPYNVVATLNSAGQVTKVTTPKGRTVSYGYSGSLLSSITDVRGHNWIYTYSSGRLIGEADPLSHTRLSAVYDATGRVTTVSAQGSAQHTDDTFSWDASTQTSTRRALINVRGTPTREPYVDKYLNNVLVSQTQPSGAMTCYAYDAQVNLIEAQDPMGWVQQLAYDANNNLISQSTPINSASTATVSMTYDPSHRITSQTDADGNTTVYVYNGPYLGFIRSGAGNQSVTTLYYNKVGELTQTVTPIGQRLFSYDAAGNQTGVLLEDLSGRPLNGKGTLATYDEAGDLLTSTDARGTTTGPAGAYTTTRTYDAAGNLLSTTTPGSQTTSTTYDVAGDISTIVDAAGNTTTYAWNETTLTRTTTATAAGAATSTTSTQLYDPSGDLLTERNAANRTTTHVFDAAGREVATTDPANVTAQYTYDLEGNVVKVTDSAGDTITRQFDSLNRPIREVNDGAVTRTGYDPVGNVTSTTDAGGSITTTTYTANNQVGTVTNAAGTTSYGYDDAGDLISRTDPNGHITTYSYDGAGRQTLMTVNGATTSYGYDVAGNVATTTDPDGRATTYTLDARNRPTKTVYAQSGQPSITVTQAYDALGHRIGMTDPSGTHTYTYDMSGDLTSAATVNGNHTDTFSYDFSKPGKIVETYPDGTPITYAVDDAQNLMSVTTGSVNVSYIRNILRQTVGIAFSNGVLDTRTLDQAGNVLDQTLQNASTTLADDAFTYDAAGNRLTQVNNVGGTATTNQYGYDTTGRLTGFATSTATVPLATTPAATVLTNPAGTTSSLQSATSGALLAGSAGGAVGAAPPFRTVSTAKAASVTTVSTLAPAYIYDPAGNQLSAVSAAGTTSSTYNAADQITSQTGPGGATTWTYDQRGDVTQIKSPNSTQTYTYDAADHLVKVATMPGVTVTYTYDGDGNRVSKTAGGITTQYLWDPAGAYPQLAIERTGAGTLIRRYIYGDGPVAMQTPSATYFYHLDPRGSVAELSDSTGSIVASYHYDGFGNVTTVGANPPANPLLFQGQYLDTDTGLYDMRARDYDPTTGRFTQRDPVVTPVGVPVVSPYVFVADRPTVLADPTGQFPTATAIFWGRDTVAGNVIGDGTFAVKAFNFAAVGLPKVFSYLKSILSSETTTAVEEIAPDIGEAGGVASEVATDTASLDGAFGEIGAELGPGSEVLADAAEASKVGPALSVIGIALQVAVTITDCIYGTVTQCVADAVGTAISIVFTVGCTVLTEGAGAVACGIVGTILSVGIEYVITAYGPRIAAGVVSLYNDAAAGISGAIPTVTAGLVTAGNAIVGAADSAAGAIATGFNETTTAISSGFSAALTTLVDAGYSAAQLADVLANTFQEGLNDTVGALISLGYTIDQIAQAVLTDFSTTAEEAAALFKDGFDYTVNQIAGMLRNVYDLGDVAAAQVLKDVNYAVDEVAGALSSVYGDAATTVASVLKGLNYSIEQIGAALQQVFQETDQAVAAALKTLGYTADQVAGALVNLYNDTAQAVATALKDANYAVNEVAGALKDIFAEAGQAAAGILKDLGYGVDAVAGALQSVYSFADQQVAQILENINFTIDQVAGSLKNVFHDAARAVATVLRNIGNTAVAIASALNTVFTEGDVAVAAALAFAGFAAAEVAGALKSAFNDTDAAVATALKAAGYAVTAITAALQSVFNDTAQAVATALKRAGFAVDQIAQALRSVYAETAEAAAQILMEIGYTAAEITGALTDVFNLSAAGVAKTLKDIGETASDIANVMENTFNESTGDVANLLSSIGFSNSTIDAIGGGFSSFGQSVKNCFTSLFSDC
jgi:RHS repeat-associated protein